MNRFSAIAICSALLLTLPFALPVRAQDAAHAPEPPNLAALVKAAAKEGQLDIAWGDIYGGADDARIAQDAINKKYHINLQIKYSPVANGAAFQNQVVQEIRAGQTASTDILFHIRDQNQAKSTIPVDYRKYVPNLPNGLMFYGNRSVIAVSTILAEEYSTKDVPPNKVPTLLTGLLTPEWKGKVATMPYQGVIGWYLGLPDVLGKDRMVKFYTELSANIGGLMTCGDSDRVVSGEFAFFGLDCGDQEVRLRQRKGEPIGSIYPKEGTAIYAFSPGIPLTAAHPNAARLFITYLLSPDGQKMLWDQMGCDNYLLPGSRMAPIIAAAKKKGVRFIDIYGIDVQHPELNDYQRIINTIVNQSK
jgi:ABC-type Fe3+ transport system substrate-binding protein